MMNYKKDSDLRCRFSCASFKAFVLMLSAFPYVLFGGSIEVDPQKSVIVLTLPENPTPQASSSISRAADELQKHLELITRVQIPIVEKVEESNDLYQFHVGQSAPSETEVAEPQASRWVIGAKTTYFDGDTTGYGDGALFAVYSFLQAQLGVTWIEPGDEGMVVPESATLVLQTGSYAWTPELVFRKIRQGIRKNQPHRPIGRPATDDFLLTMEEHNHNVIEVERWMKRMRMGGHRPGGGHAFRDWWDKYGETHPEYFALNKFGKREPVPLPKGPKRSKEFIKVCPSNPHVAQQIIEDWLPKKKLSKYISTGPNDGRNYCRCPDCLALDVRRPGEEFTGHLTDRYVYLANIVARKAREHRPDVYAALYAYLATLEPPRQLKLEPNVVVHIVPYVVPLKVSVARDLFEGWKNAGATKLALRPNYHHKYMTTAFPLGIEKQMFDVFQEAFKNGAISADYDMLMDNWAVTGMADYVLANAMSEPSKSFEHWEDQYYQAYGNAADEVKEYFRYWRNEVWEKRLLPNIDKITEAGRAGNFVRGLMWTMKDNDYYREDDFDRTDAILEQARAKNLTPREDAHLQQLILANQHARLVFHAAVTQGQERYRQAMELTEFRKRHQDVLRLSWVRLIGLEDRYGWTEVGLVEHLKDYPLPWLQTGLAWKFKADPQNVGEQENWHKLTVEDTKDWKQLRTDNFWEHAYDSETDPELKKQLEDYDGVGWFVSRLRISDEMQSRQVFLVFGGVGDACQVFVNGKNVGSHQAESEEDKKNSFAIRIDPAIDWTQNFQNFSIRVENHSGLGGLYDRIWLVSKQP